MYIGSHHFAAIVSWPPLSVLPTIHKEYISHPSSVVLKRMLHFPPPSLPLSCLFRVLVSLEKSKILVKKCHHDLEDGARIMASTEPLGDADGWLNLIHYFCGKAILIQVNELPATAPVVCRRIIFGTPDVCFQDVPILSILSLNPLLYDPSISMLSMLLLLIHTVTK